MRTCGNCLFMRAKIPVGPDGRILYRKAKASCVKGRIRNNQGELICFTPSQRLSMHQAYSDDHLYKHWMAAENCLFYNPDNVDLV